MINCDEETLRKFVAMLKKEGMFHSQNEKKIMTPFQKTEQVLYKYQFFVDAIAAKQKRIEELKKYGIKHQSKSITKYGAGSGEVKTDQDKLDDKIKAIEDAINDTQLYIDMINDALDKIRNDEYFPIIEMKYGKSMTHEEIGEELEVDATTVGRNKNKLIRKLSIQLFPDESISELMS